jgi:hypothetical protein
MAGIGSPASLLAQQASPPLAWEAAGTKATFSIFDVGGGVRWTPTVKGSLIPFVQFVAGAVGFVVLVASVWRPSAAPVRS